MHADPNASVAEGQAHPRLHGRCIVCVGFADWETPLWTNQHHLMSRLALTNQVLFVESLGLRQPTLAGRDVSRMIRRVRRGLSGPRTLDGLQVVSPLVIPLHRHRIVRRLNRRLIAVVVGRAARRLGMERPILWAYVPQAEALLAPLRPRLVVYHAVDDIAAQAGVDADSFRSAERRFIARADLVLASAPAIRDRLARLSPNVEYAPNVADTVRFSQALEPGPVDPELAELPAPRIVFTGAITETKLDVDLIVALARLRRDWTIALVGPVGLGAPRTDTAGLADEPNIRLLGQRPYTELPAVLRGADAAIIPYLRNELTDSIFPMKVYEYLAAGLPVVATELPSLSEVDEVVRAADADGFARELERLLARDDPDRRRHRSQVAAAHSWDARLGEIAALISAREPADARSAG
jgi:glycosyltransferase involved in cell wall biosynthesis